MRRISAQLGFERLLWEHVREFLIYARDIEQISDVNSGADLGEFDHWTHNLVSFLEMLQVKTCDTIVEPHRGPLPRLSFEVIDLLLGSEANYIKITGAPQCFLLLA